MSFLSHAGLWTSRCCLLNTEVKMASPGWVLCVVLALLLPAVSAVVRFTKQPASVTLKEGAASASFGCAVLELDETTQVVAFEREHHVISDGASVRRATLEGLGLVAARYRAAERLRADTGAREYSLDIRLPSRNDSGRFRCVVCHAESSSGRESRCDANHKYATSDEAILTVHYPPADRYPICDGPGHGPSANDNTPPPLSEGRPAEFTCTSEMGSPAVRLDWTRDGAETAGEDRVEVWDGNGLRQSKLTVTPSEDDNGTVLACALTSDAYNLTERRCSLPPLAVAPADRGGPGGPVGGANIAIFIVLAVIVVLLILAIVVALFMRRKTGHEPRGHKIEYRPAASGDAGDELRFETHRDLQ